MKFVTGVVTEYACPFSKEKNLRAWTETTLLLNARPATRLNGTDRGLIFEPRGCLGDLTNGEVKS